VPSALPLVCCPYRSRFAGWLGVCLLLLQALAISCHEPGAISGTEAGTGYSVAAYICRAPGSPANSPQKVPVKHAFACAFHACGCCPAILTGTADLLPRPGLPTAKVAGYRSTGFTPKAILSNPSVRGPPAYLA